MITFISAFAGGIELTVEGKANNYWASNAKDLASFIAEFGIADSVYHSSTMDFADEEGFDNHDGAWKLWNDAYFYTDWVNDPTTSVTDVYKMLNLQAGDVL